MTQFENVYLYTHVFKSSNSALAFISQCLLIESVFMNLVREKGQKRSVR